MIDNFSVLENYSYPSILVNKLLDIYNKLGKVDIYLEKLDSIKDRLSDKCLILDSYYLIKELIDNGFLTDVTDARIKYILTKEDVSIKNNKEKMILNVKLALKSIRNTKSNNYISIDILDKMNLIFNNKVSLDYTNTYEKYLSKNKTSESSRHAYDVIIDKSFIELKKGSEKIMVSLITYLETKMLKPFKIASIPDFDSNYISSLLVLYYYLFHNNINVFETVSFFKIMYENKEELKNKYLIATSNYFESFFKLNDYTMYFLDLINISYNEFLTDIKEYKDADELNKFKMIENTIYNMKDTFTKDDIRELHPYVSDSTIMRVFDKLKKEKIIMPMGLGRSAKWLVLISDKDIRRMIH